MTPSRETCGECRFNSDAYPVTDIVGTIRGAATRWRWLAEGIGDRHLSRRPAPTTWSVVEYVAHTAEVLEVHGRLLHAMTTTDLPSMPATPSRDAHADDHPPSDTFETARDRLATNADRYARTIARTPKDALTRTATIGEDTFDAGWLIRHSAHDTNHHLADGGRVLAAIGQGVATQAGVIGGVFASNGGVPKLPIESAHVGYRGLDGDRQAERRHHGRVWQALCLWSADVVEQLRAEGHAIAPGNAGENISVVGIEWSKLRPGARVRLGDDVVIELASWSPPCAKNARWFADRDFSRIDHDKHPGWSRAYASVLADGEVRPGDPVVVEPS